MAVLSISWRMFCTWLHVTEADSRQEVCLHSKQTESDWPRQNEDLVPKIGASSVAWIWFGYEN